MSKLQEYVQLLHNEVNKRDLTDEREIIRFVYMDFGKRMNFDINYALGNSREKGKIYDRRIGDKQLEEAFESRVRNM